MLLPPTAEAVSQFWLAHERGERVGLRTSGTTTGNGRVIVRSTGSWVASFGSLAASFGLDSGMRMWIPGPFSSTMNLFAAVLAEYLGGLWSTEPRGMNIAQLTPATLERLLAEGVPEGITRAIVAGDGMSVRLRDRARRSGLDVLHYYGAAELSLVAVGTCCNDLRLFDRVQARLDGQTLWVRSPWLADDYAESDEQFEFRDGFVTVGDQARLSGERIWLLGRPGTITTAGQTIFLAPLRERLSEVASGEFWLGGLPNESVGQVLTVACTPADLPVLRGWARENLSGADRPRRWIACEDFPLTEAGKLDERALVEMLVAS